MAILKKTILGDPTGSVNELTFSTWKGKTVVKSRPKSVNDPNTVKQQCSRSKFRLLGSTLVPLSEIINIGWNSYIKSGKKACTAHNSYMKYHLKEVDESVLFNGEWPEYTSINVDKLLLSRGSYQGLLSAEYNVGAMDFRPTYYDDQPTDDITYAVLYESDLNRAVYAKGTVEQGDIDLAKPDSYGENTHLFAFTTNSSGSKVSTCLYLGTV